MTPSLARVQTVSSGAMLPGDIAENAKKMRVALAGEARLSVTGQIREVQSRRTLLRHTRVCEVRELDLRWMNVVLNVRYWKEARRSCW